LKAIVKLRSICVKEKDTMSLFGYRLFCWNWKLITET